MTLVTFANNDPAGPLSSCCSKSTPHPDLSPARSQCTLMFSRGIVCSCEVSAGYWEISLCLSVFTSIISLLTAPWGTVLQGKAKLCHPRWFHDLWPMWHRSVAVKSCDLSLHRRESRLGSNPMWRFIALSHPWWTLWLIWLRLLQIDKLSTWNVHHALVCVGTCLHTYTVRVCPSIFPFFYVSLWSANMSHEKCCESSLTSAGSGQWILLNKTVKPSVLRKLPESLWYLLVDEKTSHDWWREKLRSYL